MITFITRCIVSTMKIDTTTIELDIKLKYIYSMKFIACAFVLICAGIITTKARIDYESIKQIYVNAYVTDTGIPQMTSTAEITIEIVNMNDIEPIFSLPEYRFTVAENSPKGTFIGKINAKDDDDGKLFVH